MNEEFAYVQCSQIREYKYAQWFNEVQYHTSFYNKLGNTEYDVTYTYREFEHFLYTTYNQNQNASQRYYSLQAKIVRDRMESCPALSIENICQADFVAWLYHLTHKPDESRFSR